MSFVVIDPNNFSCSPTSLAIVQTTPENFSASASASFLAFSAFCRIFFREYF